MVCDSIYPCLSSPSPIYTSVSVFTYPHIDRCLGRHPSAFAAMQSAARREKKSRVERLKAKVEPLLTQVTVDVWADIQALLLRCRTRSRRAWWCATLPPPCHSSLSPLHAAVWVFTYPYTDRFPLLQSDAHRDKSREWNVSSKSGTSVNLSNSGNLLSGLGLGV